MLDPAGPEARSIAMIWHVMAWSSAAILVLMLALVFRACRRTPKSGEPARAGLFLFGGGIVFPGSVLLLLLIYGLRTGDARTPFPDEPGVWRVEIHARQWWWEVRHPDAPQGTWTTRNEIHAPVHRPLHISVTAHDVIHSFWIPRLGGKIDAIPGRVNTIRLMAEAPGTYQGVCAEFCGTGHAAMSMRLHAYDDDTFRTVLKDAADD